jgi:hypothetical protein
MGGSNLYRWLWIGRPDLSIRPRSNLERPTQHGRLRFNGSEGVRSNLISVVRERLDGGAFSSGRWRRGRTHTAAAPLELAGAMPPGHSDGRNSPIFLPTGAAGCKQLTEGHRGGSGHREAVRDNGRLRSPLRIGVRQLQGASGNQKALGRAGSFSSTS